MPYPKGHRERTRKRIIQRARLLFNVRGYDGVSIDDIMADAGLTRGGFYAHFKSKAELFIEAVKYILIDHPARSWSGIDFDLSNEPSRKIINAYLSKHHLDDIEASCPLVTQSSEAARGGPEIQEAYRRVLTAMTSVFSHDVTRRGLKPDIGLALAALCVGGLALARGVGDQALANRIRNASREAALTLGKWSERREK